jgi:hypothetical protein
MDLLHGGEKPAHDLQKGYKLSGLMTRIHLPSVMLLAVPACPT